MIKLIQGDCLEKMSEIEPGSVDAVIVDPPYGTIEGISGDIGLSGKTDWDTRIDMGGMFLYCERVLRMNGALIIFGQDPFTVDLITAAPGNLPYSYRYTWVKDHFANGLLAKKAPVNYTEDVLVFFKKYDTLNQHPLRDYAKSILDFIGVESLKDINRLLGHRKAEHFLYLYTTQFGICTEPVYREMIDQFDLGSMPGFLSYTELEKIDRRFKRRFKRRFNLPPGKKSKSNVLQYKKDYTGHHPTQKPVALMEDIVSTYTNEGDTVLDFAMGSGSTGVACKNLNRNFIGIELDPNYFKVAEERIASAAGVN